MKRLLIVIFQAINISLFGTTYYVATNGNDSNPGTINEPFATWHKGFQSAKAGDLVYIRGGVYYTSGVLAGGEYHGVYVSGGSSGTPDNMIRIWAYPGETPILDCINMTQTAYVRNGIFLSDINYWWIKGLHIRNVKDSYAAPSRGFIGVDVSHCLFEQCTISGSADGFALTGFSDYNKYLNCDAYDNSDVRDGGDFANGWTASGYGSGGGTHLEIVGCRSWHNSDDGFDFLNADGYSGGGYITLTNCWAFRNGYSGGNGVGFKLGNGYSPVDGGTQRIITNCLAWNNSQLGIDEGQDPSRINTVAYNNTSYHNRVGFTWHYTNSGSNAVLRNNISFSNTTSDVYLRSSGVTQDHNSWNGGITVSASDFISLDDTGTDGPRQSDGSLPNLNFLRLAPSSDLVNAGTNVGLPYGGSAPDLGAFESDIQSYVPPTPVYTGSSIANSTPSQLEITYNLTLAGIVPAASAFSVQVNSVSRNITSVSVSGTKVLLTLANPVVYEDKITVAYSVPEANPLQSSNGQKAEALSARSVNNNVYPPSPQYISSAVQNSDPSILEINYSLTLANVLPATSVYNVYVNSNARTVTSVSISGNKVFLRLASPVVYGNVITFAYTRPSTNPLQSAQGGWAPSLSTQNVTNNVSPAPPVYLSSAVENSTPSIIELTYNLSLANIVPATSAFSVLVNSVTRSISSVTVSGTKVLLTLGNPVSYGNVVTVSYTVPSSNPIQTTMGVKADGISAKSVTNRVAAVSQPPVVITPPAVPNTPPVVRVNYIKENYSGFVGVLNASGSYDQNKDNLTFTWKIPDNIPVSSTTGPIIEFLAPIVSSNKTYNFTVTVSDGKAPQSKTIPVEIIPYQSGLETAEIISVEAGEFQSPNQPDNVIDGNKGTSWSVNGDDQWIILELKGPFNVQHIILAFQPEQKKEFYFDILGSNDKEVWDPILTKAKSCPFSGDFQVFNFPDSKSEKEFRYVKLVGQGNSIDKWNFIAEFRIFGYRHTNPTNYEEQIVKIYPNPAYELVNILIDEPSFVPDFIKIVTLAGKVIYTDKIDPDTRQLQIPINLKQGLYIVQMGTGDLTIFTQKLVVSN